MATTPPTLALPYSTTQAFKINGRLHELERDALIDAIQSVLSDSAGPSAIAFSPTRVYETASALLPLLQRAVAVRSSDNAGHVPAAAHKTPLEHYDPIDAGIVTALEAELANLEAIGLFSEKDSVRVFDFLKAWRSTDNRLLTPAFHERARSILVLDNEACESLPGYAWTPHRNGERHAEAIDG